MGAAQGFTRLLQFQRQSAFPVRGGSFGFFSAAGGHRDIGKNDQHPVAQCLGIFDALNGDVDDLRTAVGTNLQAVEVNRLALVQGIANNAGQRRRANRRGPLHEYSC
jgi:hypothetical protein